MGIVFRVGYDRQSQQIELQREGVYVVTTVDEGIVKLFDDEESSDTAPKSADTFERALALMPGWEQGVPLLVDPIVADCVSAAVVSHTGRLSSAWREWLQSGRLVER